MAFNKRPLLVCSLIAFSNLFLTTLVYSNSAVSSSKFSHLEKDLHLKYSYFKTTTKLGEKKTYHLVSYILVENCQVSAALEVYDQGKLLDGESLSAKFELNDRFIPIKLPYKVDEHWGWYLMGSEPNQILVFPSDRKRYRKWTKLRKLQRLCQYKNKDKPQPAILNNTFPSRPDSSLEQDVVVLNSNNGNASNDQEEQQEHIKFPGTKISLIRGRTSYIERYRTASKAKKTIKVETLHFKGDHVGIDLSDLLINKKEQGVDVKVMLDALTPFLDVRDLRARQNTYRMYNNLMAAGIPVTGFDCRHPRGQVKREWLNSRRKKGTISFMKRAHEKIWVVDDYWAIAGGANISNDYLGINPPGKNFWRDQDLLLVGHKLASSMSAWVDESIYQYLERFPLKPGAQHCLNPYQVGTVEYQEFFSRHFKYYFLSEMGRKFQEENKGLYETLDNLKKGIVDNEVYRNELKKVDDVKIVYSRPLKNETHIEAAYLNLINESTEEIILANAYFIPSLGILQALKSAANRGVKIYILTNGTETQDPPIIMTPLARTYYKEMLDVQLGTQSEVKIFEWTGRENGTGKKVKGMFHGKFGIFDRRKTLIGSYNFDSVSRNFNSELVVIFKDLDLSKQLRDQFFENDLRHTIPITYSQSINFRRPHGFKDKMLLRVLKKFEYRL